MNIFIKTENFYIKIYENIFNLEIFNFPIILIMLNRIFNTVI